MNCTNTGLKNFDKERNLILADAMNLISLCKSESGHLGDVIGCIRTTMSSLELKANKLSDIFKEQKKQQICPNCKTNTAHKKINGFYSPKCDEEY
jgi:hypothetical protein